MYTHCIYIYKSIYIHVMLIVVSYAHHTYTVSTCAQRLQGIREVAPERRAELAQLQVRPGGRLGEEARRGELRCSLGSYIMLYNYMYLEPPSGGIFL